MRKLFSTLSSTLQRRVRRGILLLALIASTSAIYASDTQVDSIWYDFDSSTLTASVTYQGSTSNSYNGEYSGSVIIPETVTYNGATYSVTSIGSTAFLRCSSLTSVTIPNSVTSIGSSAFSGCSGLTSVTIGEKVISIGSSAFSNCSSLTKTNYTGDIAGWCDIKFGNSSANPIYYSHNFYINDVEIKDLVIPNSVDSIHNYAFYGCSSLTFVTIPNSVTSIGGSAFSGCSGLTSLTIPNSVTSIGSSAFSNCSSLTKTNYAGDIAGWCDIKFGNSSANPIYYSHNFYINDVEIKDLVIPNSVDSIHNAAFFKCSSLTSVTIPNSVTSIGDYAFEHCSSLTSVTIPNSVTSIGNYVFSGCSALKSIVWNAKNFADPSSISMAPFYGITSQIKSFTLGENVEHVPAYLCYAMEKLTSIIIPKGVTSIGSSAFSGCTFIKDNFINHSTLDAEANNYWGATIADIELDGLFLRNDTVVSCRQSVTMVIIPDYITCIGSSAFYGCSGLTSVTIPNSVTSIGSSAFYGCSGLTSVTIPNSVTSIGSTVFYNCSSLTSVTIGEKVISIGSSAFANCSSLTKTNFAGDIAGWCDIKFGSQSANPICYSHNFYINDVEIKDLVIPNSVDSIHNYAFYDCSSLTSVTIGEKVTSIGSNAFSGCSKLTSVTINSDAIVNKAYSSTSNISRIFGSQVTKCIIGDEVTGIGNYAFYRCSSLASVTIGESMTSIGSSAFSGCSSLTKTNFAGDIAGWCDIKFGNLSANPIYYSHNFYINDVEIKDLVIPNSVDSIHNYAFSGCSALSSITCEAATPPTIGSSAFSGVSISIPVYVPCGCVEAYKAKSSWKDFTNIQEQLAEYSLEVDVNDSIMGTAKVEYNTFCKSNRISATPNLGYHFVQWSDGNTENPRTLELTQDTILIAEFAQSFSGQCGENLYWELIETTLHITGSGEMYNYTSDTAPWKLLVSSIKVLTIAEDVTSIGEFAFSGCSFLTSVTIPNSVTSIGNSAFEGCSSLTSVTISNSVTSIGFAAFAFCSSLTSVTIPNSVTSIGNDAFYGCSGLTSLTIPNSVTSIGDWAFSGCSALSSITCEAATPPTIGSSAFNGVSKSIPVYVPCGCVEVYEAKSGWKNFTNIQEPLAEYSITVDVNDTIMGSAKVDYNTFCKSNQISATANINYQFVQWSDGNTDNPRTLLLTQDTILTAEFAPKKYTITTVSSNTQRGTTQGDTIVNYLDIVTICANANYGYHFTQWNDGNLDNPRQVQVTEDTTYTAEFDKNTYAISLSCNEEQGRVEGVTSAEYLDTVTISATPNFNYKFVQWSDGNSDNPRTLVLTQDTILTAEFALISSGQCGDNLYWEFVDTTLHITGKGAMYDYNGDSIPWRFLVDNIKSVTIADGITSLRSDAFSNCSKLTSVTINSDAIVNKSYSSSSNISQIFGSQVTKYMIGNTVKSIGKYAFSGCYSLTSVTIPNSVTSIGDYAFSGCYSLTSVTIPNSVTSIGDYAFFGCSSLTSVTIPNSVTSIGSSAFDGCFSLMSIDVDTNNPNCSSANGVLFNKDKTKLIQYPKGKQGAYTIPNSVTSIGNGAFENCFSLTSITIPNSVTSIGNDAFSGCSKLTSVTINSDAIVKKAYSSSSNISHIFGSQVTEYIIGDKVKGIGKYAFSGCYSLTSVTIPNSVTSIGNYAFQGCSGLTSVTIPNSVTSIGSSAFDGCYKLTSITIPNSVTSIGNFAFDGCYSLTKTNYTGDIAGWCNIMFGNNYANPMYYSHKFYINDQEINDLVIPNNVTSIGSYAFFGCSSLTSVTIPNSVTSIGNSAFKYCSSLPVENNLRYADTYLVETVDKTLSTYSIKKGTKWIGSSAFEDCSSLTSMTIPNSVTSIGNSAFKYCSSLTSVTIGNSVTSIGNSAFQHCSSLTSVTVGEKVTSIGDYAFFGCSSLTKTNYAGDIAGWCDIKFGDSSANPISYSNNFYINDQEIKDLVIPNTVNSIHGYAFYFCSSLTSLTIPESVTSIGFAAFDDCSSLTSITIGEKVTSIGNFAFDDCSSLTSITCEAENPPTVYDFAFSNVSTSIPVYVPCGCVEAYKTASGWKDFYKIQETLYSIEVDVNDTRMGSAKVDWNRACDTQISASPNIGYHFVQWNDGNTDNPRTLELTQNTALTAEFAQSFSGQCGDNLYWNYDETTKTISITGSGKMYDYTATTQPWLLFKEQIVEVTTTNTVTSIGTSAFEGCIRLSKISLGTGLEKIAANTFAGCNRLYDIYVYATYPPFADESSFANYNVYVYIPCEYQRGYTLDVVWGKFKFIECIESEDATTDGDVTVDPGFNNVTITWPTEDNADNYTIVIEKDGKVFCTLTFNAAGQLLNIAFAPSRDGSSRPVQYAEQAVNGYRFTVTGLDEGSAYIYELVIKDNGDNVLQTYSGEFRTQSIDDRTVTVKYDTMQGEVIGAGTYLLGDTATLTVIPNEGYRFVGWTDGNADNPRTLVVTQDTTLTVVFEVLTYNVTVTCDPIQGSITGSGTYNHGDGVTLTAIPNEGYRFVGWTDGNADNPRTLVVTQDTTLTALFEVLTYDVTVTCDPTQGTVTGSGTYNHGDVATLTAIPNEGYRFVRWSNEVEDNPYIFVISEDVTLSAEFEEIIPSSVENTNGQSPMTNYQKVLYEDHIYILREGKVYSVMGHEM